MQNDVAEVKIRAEREAGKLLQVAPKNRDAQGVGVSYHDVSTPKLEDMGITHKESSRWQLEAKVPDSFPTRVGKRPPRMPQDSTGRP